MPATDVGSVRSRPLHLPWPCITTRKCASGSPPGSLPESQTTGPAAAEAIAATESLPRPPPKKDGKAPAADFQGSSAPPTSQPSPCHSGRETSHRHKSHKKDSGGKKKKMKDAIPTGKSSSHKAHKDGGHC